jgi:large subunit ribosomal protein L3
MSGFILGTKSEQNQTYDHNGVRVPTTFIKTAGCFMVDVKTSESQGYFAVKLGLGNTKNIKKPVQGELTKAGIKTPLRFLKEIRLEKFGENVKLIEENGKKGIEVNGAKVFVGDEVKPEIIFKKDEMVTVTGTSKGKGYQGVVKRHHFKGGSRTHGQSHGERAPGSIGMTTTPGRVFKGKRMAGRMGNDRVTVKNLKIMEIKADGLVVKGLVAGHKGNLLEVKSS